MVKTTLNFIWRYPTVALLVFSCFGVAAIASPMRGAESVNGIAAIVNDKVITYSEVREVVEPRERLLRSQYSGQELVNKITELRKAALQDLIDRRSVVLSSADLELKDDHQFTDQQDRVSSPANPRDFKLEEQMTTGNSPEGPPENFHLLAPRQDLRLLHLTMALICRQLPKDLGIA
jgi:hypothetical protein